MCVQPLLLHYLTVVKSGNENVRESPTLGHGWFCLERLTTAFACNMTQSLLHSSHAISFPKELVPFSPHSKEQKIMFFGCVGTP